ncbi:MAG: precorrin-3B synthase [Roseobacter sp.]
MSTAPLIKGWCPGAYRPMLSGDGLVVRIRPRLGRLSRQQAERLCDLSVEYGNATLEMTSRANLQIRGVSEQRFEHLLADLLSASFLDDTPAQETRRNIIVTPDWRANGLTERLHARLLQRLQEFPELPAKMGVALDTGYAPLLSQASADFRFEGGATCPLVLRADGAATGLNVSEEDAVDALIALMTWFVETGGARAGRMARHLQSVDVAEEFQGVAPLKSTKPWHPGQSGVGAVYGAPFGVLDALAFKNLMASSGASGMRMTPWRLFVLEGAEFEQQTTFVSSTDDPLLGVQACPGAPSCAQAESSTRDVARKLAGNLPSGHVLHVSGCAKGCAFPKQADVTLVGANGLFDLVTEGAAWDEPVARGLLPEDLAKEMIR